MSEVILMDLRQPHVFASALSIALLFGSTFAWLACRWWYGRKLGAAARRLEKVEQGRQLAQQQNQHARRQIEQLKAELEARQPVATAGEVRRTTGDREATRAGARAASGEKARELAGSTHGFAETLVQRGGFAETHIQRGGFAKTQILR